MPKPPDDDLMWAQKLGEAAKGVNHVIARLTRENDELRRTGLALQAQHDRVGIAAPISMLNQHGEAAAFFEALNTEKETGG